MKKNKLLLLLILFVNISKGQTTDPSLCPYSETVAAFVSSSDSLAKIFHKMKLAISPTQWNGFMSDVNNGVGLASFDNVGSFGSVCKSEYLAIGLEIESGYKKIRKLIDPNNTLTEEQIKLQMSAAINCHINNSSVEITFSPSNSEAPVLLRMDGGPCEIASGNCMREEKRALTTNLIGCGLGGAALGSGFFGSIAGLICAGTAYNSYNNGVIHCMNNYCECAGIRCPTIF